MSSRKPQPPPAVPTSLGGPARPTGPADRFANPLATAAAPAPAAAAPAPPADDAKRREPAGRVRKTYFYSTEVAAALAAAVSRLHHGSGGEISKADALDAIISAGVEQVDAIEQRLRRHA